MKRSDAARRRTASSGIDFVAVIPARYASTRFPGKPLATIGGKPMILHVAERAARSGASAVLIATDDQRIAEVAIRAGHRAVMTRADHATGTDRLAEVVRKENIRADRIVVNVQGDEPLIAPALIRSVAQSLASHQSASIATACHPIHDVAEWIDPNVVKVVMDREGYALYFSRAPIPWQRSGITGMNDFAAEVRQRSFQLPTAYRHLGIYAYRAAFITRFQRLKPAAIETAESLEQLRALAEGFRISVAIARTAPAPGVDTMADLARVRRLWRQR